MNLRVAVWFSLLLIKETAMQAQTGSQIWFKSSAGRLKSIMKNKDSVRQTGRNIQIKLVVSNPDGVLQS
jgi:hypothetical protein